MTNEYKELIGKKFPIEDTTLHVVDVKMRESGPWVTYETIYPHAMPRRAVIKIREFFDRFGQFIQNDTQ